MPSLLYRTMRSICCVRCRDRCNWKKVSNVELWGGKWKSEKRFTKAKKARLSFYIQFIFSPLKRAQRLEIMIEFFNFINGRLCGCYGNLTQAGKKKKKWPNAVLSGLICCLEIVGSLSIGLTSPSCSACISTTTLLTWAYRLILGRKPNPWPRRDVPERG